MHKHLFSILLIAPYPLIVHASVIFELPKLQTLALVILLFGIFWTALLRKSLLAWLTLFLLLCVVFTLSYFSLIVYLLYITPVVIPLALLFFFGRTLLPGQEPLITQISEAARGPLTPNIRKYTRFLTQMWSVVFFLMAVWSIILLTLHRPQLWSWFTNVINYGLVGILFAGEFLLRKILFPTQSHPSFLEHIETVAKSKVFRPKDPR